MENHNQPMPFIPEIKSFIPDKVKPYILIFFALIIQVSGGVYLSVSGEMSSATSLMNEDIQMAGFAALIGMSLDFVYMFRIRCAAPSKYILLLCGSVIICANIATMYVTNVPLLVGICFVTGFFRMQAMFQCMSSIQRWITPNQNFAVWFCWIGFIVNSMLSVSGLLDVFVSDIADWRNVQWCIIGLVLLMMLIVWLCFQEVPPFPRIPFLGIDYLGMLLWGCFCLCILFVAVYGDFYDWWYSWHIRTATVLAVILFCLNLWRASFIRHPYIFISTMKQPITWLIPLTYIAADLLLAPQHIFEHTLMEGVLGYDSLHVASLNWVSLAGAVIAAIFSWQTFGLRQWRYRTMIIISFACFSFYLLYFYCLIDYNLPKSMLVAPVFIRSFGYAILAISLLTATTKLPFPFAFFQGITIQNSFSAALAGSIGTAVVGRVLKYTMASNSQNMMAAIDHVNPCAQHRPVGELLGIVQQQSVMISMKEIYGWLFILSLVFLLFLIIRRGALSEPVKFHPISWAELGKRSFLQLMTRMKTKTEI